MKQFFLFLGVVLSVLVSCAKKQETNIYYNKNFEELTTIANGANLPFCVVLIDSTLFTAEEYINVIKACKTSYVKTIYDFINIHLSENKWYPKLLSPQLYPITCVFNTTGELIDLVPGNSNESFAYISHAIKTELPSVEFHYNQRYDQCKIELIKYINSAVKLKSKIDKDQYVVDEIDSLLQIAQHPYLLYLKLNNQIQFKKTLKLKKRLNNCYHLILHEI